MITENYVAHDLRRVVDIASGGDGWNDTLMGADHVLEL
jgi:hypothetical protein